MTLIQTLGVMLAFIAALAIAFAFAIGVAAWWERR